MIGSSASIVRSFCTLAVIVLCAGCASLIFNSMHDRFGFEDHVDLTSPSSSGVANIRGTNRNLIGLLGEYCWVKSPGNAKRVTVDAGPVDIVAMCVLIDSIREESDTYYAVFHFDALAGHEYEIGGVARCGCMRLRDATTDEVVAESPTDNKSVDQEMISIEPGKEVVVKERYIRFYECPDSYVLFANPEPHYWIRKKAALSCVTPGSEKTKIEPGEEVKVLAKRYLRFYECPEPYVMVEVRTPLTISSYTVTCEESESSNDE